MAIVSFRMDFPGQVGIYPRVGKLQSTDDLATVAGAGYLDAVANAQSISVTSSDIVAVTASDGNEFYRPTVSSTGVITLNLIS